MLQLSVAEIWQQDDRTLVIVWTDSSKSYFDVVKLRKNCRCAICYDQAANVYKIKVENISDSVRPKTISSVGNYALKIVFNDDHKSSLYSYSHLKHLAQQ